MHYKNIFSAAALVAVLSLSSNSAFSDPVGLTSDDETSYYVRVQYNGELLPWKTNVDGMIWKKTADDTAATTDPAYKPSFISGGAAFGYKMGEFSVDFEGLYSQLSQDTTVGNYTALAASGTKVDVDKELAAISGLVNVYYDIAMEDAPVTPYVGVGVGAAYINNPLATKVGNDKDYGFGFAYQAKVGVNYEMSPEIKFYAGGRYFGSYGAKFDKASANDGALKVLYSTIGAEAGVSFHF